MIRRFLGAAATLAVLATPLIGQTTSAVTPTLLVQSAPFLTFGGSGIPTNYVMTNGIENQTALGGTHLFLSATARYAAPTVTYTDVGLYTAAGGTSPNAPSPVNPYANWNFDWAIVGDNVTAWNYRLYYDFNPATGNFGDYGYVPVTPNQDSWNLGMDFLAGTAFGIVPPSFATFNPNVGGEYGFALVAYDANQTEVGRTALLVNVPGGDVVPEPATLSLLASGLVGMAAARRRKAKTS